MAASPFSTVTEGRRASKLSRSPRSGEWLAALKRAGKEFLADDCLGLAAPGRVQLAARVLPGVILLVGLLGPDRRLRLADGALDPVAPNGVLDDDRRRAAETRPATAARRSRSRSARRRPLGGERRDRRGDQGGQPCVRPAGDAAVLEDAADRDPARRPDRRRHGGRVPADRLRRPARRRDRETGPRSAARSTCSGRSLRWPIAFAGSCSSSRSSTGSRRTATPAAGSGSRPARSSAASMWLALSGLFALYTSFSDSYRPDVRVARQRDRAAALARLLGVRAPLRRRAQRGAVAAGAGG